MRRAASAQRREWTSRSPPRPSLRSGSSRKATSPDLAWRASTPSPSAPQPAGRLVPPRRRRPAPGQVGGEVGVAGDEPGVEERRGRVEVVVRPAPAPPSPTAPPWPSFSPASQSGYQIRSASCLTSARSRSLRVWMSRTSRSLPGAQVAPAVAPHRHQGHARRRPAAEQAGQPRVGQLGVGPAEVDALQRGVRQERRRAPGGVPRHDGRQASEGVVSHLPGADADDVLDRRQPHLAVADLVGAGGVDDGVDDPGRVGVVGEDLDLRPWARSRRCTRRPGRPRCGPAGGRSPAPRTRSCPGRRGPAAPPSRRRA